MADRIDHAAAASRLLPGRGEAMLPTHIALAQAHATLALVEQQRIANLIALADLAHERFGNYAGAAGGVGTVFEYGKTPESNMRVVDDVRRALGIGDGA